MVTPQREQCWAEFGGVARGLLLKPPTKEGVGNTAGLAHHYTLNDQNLLHCSHLCNLSKPTTLLTFHYDIFNESDEIYYR